MISEELFQRIRTKACVGKKQFDDKKRAKLAARRSNAYYGHHLKVYRCTFCNFYHMGHRTPPDKLFITREYVAKHNQNAVA